MSNLEKTVPIIQIKNLSKSFNTKDSTVHALADINLDIQKGDIYGIIGMSGAGKSTLVRCINFLEKPTSGTVLINGKDLSALSQSELCKTRQSIGMIFQQFNLLMQRTALSNICFPLEIAGVGKEKAKQRALELLELVGLSDKVNAYPSQLSGGQKQRVAIARAIATNPDVLLCDEATSALDPNTTHSILDLLKDINRRLGITIVIITHEMAVIEQICSHVAIIDSSNIVEHGTVLDIFSNPKTAEARKLIYSRNHDTINFQKSKCLRIIFNGSSSYEPVIANMVLACNVPVNIIYANSKNIDGKAFGELVIQMPDNEMSIKKIFNYLISKGIKAEEVTGYVD